VRHDMLPTKRSKFIEKLIFTVPAVIVQQRRARSVSAWSSSGLAQ
jgi:hypothetical protein